MSVHLWVSGRRVSPNIENQRLGRSPAKTEIIIQSQSERERQIPYDITYMCNLKYDTNEPIYETETDSQT